MPVGGRTADEAGFVADEAENGIKGGEKESGFGGPVNTTRHEVAGENCRKNHEKASDMGKGSEADGIECG